MRLSPATARRTVLALLIAGCNEGRQPASVDAPGGDTGVPSDSGQRGDTTPAPGGPTPGSHAVWHVTPNGSSGNAGTVTAPWSLSYALSGAEGRIQPGDTVWLRGGSYNNYGYTSTLTGTVSAPIIVRQYPGERATLSGWTFTINGADTWYWGLDVSNTSSAMPEVSGVNVVGSRIKLINLVISGWPESGMGSLATAAGQGAANTEVTGTLVYNNGWFATAGCKYGHGLYINSPSSGSKLLRDNIVFDNMAFGLHAYTVAGQLSNITAKGNAVFNNGASGVCGTNVLVGGDAPVTNLTFDSNYVYRGTGTANGAVWLGYGNLSVTSRARNNILGNTFLRPFNWSTTSNSLVVSGNQISNPNDQLTDMRGSWAGMTFSGNRWFGNGGVEFHPDSQTFSQWKATTRAQDTYITGRPSGQQVFVRPNAYEPGRAHVIVYNWSGAGSVTVSVPGLATGQTYEVRNAQRFWDAPLVSGTYGGSLTIPIAPVTPYPALIGWPAGAPSTGTTFQVFVVLPTES
jgi:hypothetical protein